MAVLNNADASSEPQISGRELTADFDMSFTAEQDEINPVPIGSTPSPPPNDKFFDIDVEAYVSEPVGTGASASGELEPPVSAKTAGTIPQGQDLLSSDIVANEALDLFPPLINEPTGATGTLTVRHNTIYAAIWLATRPYDVEVNLREPEVGLDLLSSSGTADSSDILEDGGSSEDGQDMLSPSTAIADSSDILG